MPVDVERVEPGIYVARWVGVVDAKQIIEASQTAKQLIAEHNDERLVMILDLRQNRKLPIDIRVLSRLSAEEQTGGTVGYVLVAAPRIVRGFGQVVNHIVPTHIEWVDTWDEGLTKAREMLAVTAR